MSDKSLILIVDDDEGVLGALQDALTLFGYEVQTAENGKKALKILLNTKPDLVLIDMVMPEKDGIETIPEIKKKYPKVKMIAMSGGGPGLDPAMLLNMARMLGAHALLFKPIEVEKLLKMVREQLGD